MLLALPASSSTILALPATNDAIAVAAVHLLG